MSALLDYLFVSVLLVLLALPSLIGHARERAIDRQLRDAERGGAPDRARSRTVRGPAHQRSAQKSSPRSTEPSTAT
ncbi:hypothetical protein [Streptomyces sp. NPDC020965]|uniref:hypothetical protein n=1 Tax=Streptomyces sp. NPDC020965 TaxID=3365105 RepID=UPI0037A09B13